MKVMKEVFAALLLVTLGGCVASNVTMLSNKQYASVNPDDVVIYLEESDIPYDYEKVAVIFSEGDHFWTNEADMLKDARKKAAKLGANGVLVERMKEPGTGEKVAQAVIGTEANRRAELVAVYVYPPREEAPVGPRRVY